MEQGLPRAARRCGGCRQNVQSLLTRDPAILEKRIVFHEEGQKYNGGGGLGRAGKTRQRCWGLNEVENRGRRAGGVPGNPEGRLRG